LSSTNVLACSAARLSSSSRSSVANFDISFPLNYSNS
jgi:hypothetical protein